MSDDKREKLREYLRNNRPRNNINLDNNSNNIENSNKNLEDNSNLNNSQISSNENSNQRDYDKEPIVIKDYSYFFGVSLRFISFFIGITIVVSVMCMTMNSIKEKIEIWFLFVPLIVPLAFVLCDYYAHVIRDNYKLYFTNNSINYTLDGKLKRKIYINEIPNYLLKPFWKNNLDTQAVIIVLIIVIFIFAYLLISLSKPISNEIYYFTALFFISQLFGNIIFKVLLYLWINKTLYGFRVFPTLIIAEPINPKLGTTSEFSNKQKYYFIYFYNEQIYDEVREYFLQNLGIDINKTRKLITF